MTTFAIKRPDGTIVLETVGIDKFVPTNRAQIMFMSPWYELERAGYTCVEVSVIEKGAQEPVCPRCKGAGDIEVDYPANGPDAERIDVACPDCGGTGDPPDLARVRAEEREACAVAAWAHFADTCHKKGLNPAATHASDFCAAAAIRARGET